MNFENSNITRANDKNIAKILKYATSLVLVKRLTQKIIKNANIGSAGISNGTHELFKILSTDIHQDPNSSFLIFCLH